jgi:flagellin
MSSFSQINTNIQSLQAFQNLQDTSSELAERRERLTTGKRINSAQDDSAGFAIANKLEARTRGQSQALKNIGDAQSVLSVSEGALDSQLDILQTQKEKTVQAANDSLGASERADIQSQLLELNGEVNDIAENAEFNGKKLLNGGGGGSSSQDLQFQVGAQNGDDFSVSLNSAQASDIGIESDSRTGITFEGGFEASGASLTTASSVGTSSPNEFNVEIERTGVTTDTGGGDQASFSISVSTAGGNQTSATGLSVTGAGDSGGDDNGDLNATSSRVIQLTDGSGALTAPSVSSGTTGTGIELSISSDQLNEVANESGEGSLTAFSTKSNLDVSSADSAQEAISTVDSGISSVTDQLASIGDAQTRLDFKEGNLETTRTNLESARSQIEDADFAREQTRVAKLQILQQTGTAQLAQANAASQSVLSLVGG